MLKPDFSKYNLALIKNDEIIFTSNKSGIRPIVECVIKYKGKIKDCVLHDKIIGLGAAKIIVYSGIIKELCSEVTSTPAIDHLVKNKISFEVRGFADNIMNRENTDICPMEQKALKFEDDEEYFLHVKELLKL
ncbi:DUF1893 domain-containing protein [Candidatus Woesearchaeota archaeon]|jgi:hypothetical protein|nr:DUF1893 domain-containing protein [Candidatus Woesearchaeota archaeon]